MALPAIPNTRFVYEINPTYAGCEVVYQDIYGRDYTYEVTEVEQAELFADFAERIREHVEAADAAVF